jgi:hypothetical protein
MSDGNKRIAPLRSNDSMVEMYDRLVAQAKTNEDRAYFAEAKAKVIALMLKVRSAPVR